jgi:putative MATE family efflux protein
MDSRDPKDCRTRTVESEDLKFGRFNRFPTHNSHDRECARDAVRSEMLPRMHTIVWLVQRASSTRVSQAPIALTASTIKSRRRPNMQFVRVYHPKLAISPILLAALLAAMFPAKTAKIRQFPVAKRRDTAERRLMSVSALPPAPLAQIEPPPRFVAGSIARHIVVMTGTSAVGLMAIFFSDFANIFFLGRLGDLQLLAAVGYASSIMFFLISAGIGMSIAVIALVAPALGAREIVRARRLATHGVAFGAIASSLVVAALWPALPLLLGSLGAGGRTLLLAQDYLRIVLPSWPALVLGMCASAILRSAGEAQRAMFITLTGAVVATTLDAILILWLGLGIYGAAMSAFVSHVTMLALGWWIVVHGHRLLGWPDWHIFRHDAKLIARFAMPIVLANLATPAGGAYVTAAMSHFSDSAVAGWAVVGRIIPIAFGPIFALSGAIAPIIGQNLGAQKFNRVRAALNGGLGFAASFSAAAWIFLALAAPTLVALFNANGEAGVLIVFFCRWLAPLFVFFGTLFVCNAACNALGRPQFATVLNWGRATLGTVPFVTLGSLWGSKGVLVGHMSGGIAFGLAAVFVVHRLIAQLERAPPALPLP